MNWSCILTLAALAAALSTTSARADAVKVEAYVDLRLVHAPDEKAWQDGGLGKTRYGGDGDTARLAEAGAEVTVNLSPELSAFTGVRVDPHQRTPVDLMEAYATWRSHGEGPWRFAVKAGAFYAPISLENDQIGWASSWTITPSAINSWVGEELRTVGAEGRIDWRGGDDRISAYGAVYGWNDPAGVLIAARGWALSDRPTGLFDKPRLPDSPGDTTAYFTPMFREMDGRAGWYAGVSWQHEGWGRVNVLRYDNNADPTVVNEDAVGWRTTFWSVGLETQALGFVVKAQGLTGETEIFPSPYYDGITKFRSAYLLIGRVIGQWRVAARGEYFETSQYESYGGPFERQYDDGEHGRALTLGAYYTPLEWLQLGGEALYIASERPGRAGMGVDPKQRETQVQFSARVFY